MSLVEEISQKLNANDRDYVVSKLQTVNSSYSELLANQLRASSTDEKEEQVADYVEKEHGDENKMADFKRRMAQVEKRQGNINPF